jgi:phosphoglycerate dehydrogenase-like enzyme
MKLLLTGAFKYSEEQISQIESLGYEITFVEDERVPLQIDVSGIDAVVCNGLFLYNDIAEFKNLKFIQLTSAGLDRVPLDYIKKHDIKLFNARGVYSIPMAEWVVLKILEIYKKSRHFYEAQREHRWEKQRDLLELTDKTAAIIGFGDIGSEIAKRLKAFGVHIIGVDIKKIYSDFVDYYCDAINIDKVLSKSDIVILTLPLTEHTRHLVNGDRIDRMKEKSILISVSRGGVIDENALIKAIQRDKFLGVALDVFEEEPLGIDSPLWDMGNVIITPHNSFLSDRVSKRLFDILALNVRLFRDND